MHSDKKSVQKIFENLASIIKKTDKKYIYEPSGLRGNAEDILYAVCRTSIVAYLRSSTFCGKMIGIMITASHNPIEDNGIKICDHNGEFLDNSWEKICNEAITCSETGLYPYLNRIHRKYGNMREFGNGPIGHILIGMDNRPSSITLSREISYILQHFNCKIQNYGQVTTPQLFFLTKFSNKKGEPLDASEYIKILSTNYKNLYNLLQTPPTLCYIDTANGVIEKNINLLKKEIPENILNIEIMNRDYRVSNKVSNQVDIKVRNELSSKEINSEKNTESVEDYIVNNEVISGEINKKSNKLSSEEHNKDYNKEIGNESDKELNNGNIKDNSKELNSVNASDTQINDPPPNPHLNNDCGSNYIKNTNKLPRNIKIDPLAIKRAVSFDGDADRLLLFWHDSTLHLITGDRIATLLLTYIHDLMKDLSHFYSPNTSFTIGVILSHYSNYAAINFLQKQFQHKNVKLKISPVGIKNFYKYATTFDIGIYFEPNGHGGIFFSPNIRSYLEKVKMDIDKGLDTKSGVDSKLDKDKMDNDITTQCNSISEIPSVSNISNSINLLLKIIPFFDTSISDAFSTFLLLHLLFKNTCLSTSLSKYQELYTREITVKVKNKSIIKVDTHNTVLHPVSLQNKIQEYTYKYKGRSFIRPSQSEDFIRVYTESSNKVDTDVMCVSIAQYVYDTCEGIGHHPEIVYSGDSCEEGYFFERM